MPFGTCCSVCALTSGTTSGTCGSMRQALELSMTTAPCFAAIGLDSRLTLAGVLDRTTSTPANASGRIGSTGYVLPWNVICLPALRSEARNLMPPSANLRSVSTCRITSPTAPVAPTTATLGTTGSTLSCERSGAKTNFSSIRCSDAPGKGKSMAGLDAPARLREAGSVARPTVDLSLRERMAFLSRSERSTQRGADGRQGLHTVPGKDHQALLRQPRHVVAAAPGGPRRRPVPGRGEEEKEALGGGGGRDAEARRAPVAHRPPAEAGEPGPARRAGQGPGTEEVKPYLPLVGRSLQFL